jgi:two-component system, LytTR family, response regulator
MISCVIIDDEKPARDALEMILSNYFPDKLTVVGMASSVKDGVFLIYEHHPDLVFLDIEMQDESGFKIFNYFQKVNFSVIFVTAYAEFAIKAIKVAALDYILKPVDVNELKDAIRAFESRAIIGIPEDRIEKLIGLLSPGTVYLKKIALPTFNGYQLEKIEDIMYCEASQNYTKVFIVSGEELLISKPLNSLQQLLPAENFFRIHKSYMVNLNYIKTYSRIDGYHIILENGTKLNIATRRNEPFIKALTLK